MPRYVEMPCPLGLGADTLSVGFSQDASAFQPYSLTRRPSSFAARALAYCVSLRVVGRGSRKVSTVSCLICISFTARCQGVHTVGRIERSLPCTHPTCCLYCSLRSGYFHSDRLVDGHGCKLGACNRFAFGHSPKSEDGTHVCMASTSTNQRRGIKNNSPSAYYNCATTLQEGCLGQYDPTHHKAFLLDCGVCMCLRLVTSSPLPAEFLHQEGGP